MKNFSGFYQSIADTHLSPWLAQLPTALNVWEQQQQQRRDYQQWVKILAKMDDIPTSQVHLKTQVKIDTSQLLPTGEHKKIKRLLRLLSPWRKGPFDVFGIQIDTEWRSDWKWDRLKPHIQPLTNRYVLDVGCGNGYHLWRMLGEDAKYVLGIDPSTLFWCQFQAIWRLARYPKKIHFLPLGLESLPGHGGFDTVFSMGVLYHRRSPITHLEQLKQQLRKQGELVLETLVISGDEQQLLVPSDRYAKMKNTWFIPSGKMLKLWLEKVGFEKVRIVNESATSTEEQRRTAWMQNESLQDFLDQQDPTRTVEGHPAPRRAILIAQRP